MLSSRILPRLASSTRGIHTRRSSLRRPRNAILQCHSRSYQSLTSSSYTHLLGGLSTTLDDDPSFSLYNHQQVRWKRHSGSSAENKRRRRSKKQQKRFRKQKERDRDLEKHSAPGSKAGPRREFEKELHDSWVNEHQEKLDGTWEAKRLAESHPLDDPALEYGADEAFLDDLVGNTPGKWTAQATPEPIFYGSRHRQFFNRVADQLEIYQEERKSLPAGSPAPSHLLPTDQEISLAIRAFRDKNGTKQKPVGIARALQHVLKDLRVPNTKLFGEYTYNALLSCCRTPAEGIRIFELMHQQNHQISAYSWAILTDVHAKVGDFEGCVRVMDEMYAEGHKPNLAAYTSLLAACYKCCNDGRIAHKIRAKAGEVGWSKWQELRIKGLDPDVMAYGAILRLMAARGRPEQCMNLLEEMPRFEVAPTTLCFSSALKAIARSHETAIRYERGGSKAHRRRERITAHHGKMAHQVVLLAEQAHVELDDGFISALQLCAAAAGDSATAKAIYLAYKVRMNLKHLRTIGGDDHLARLRGEDPEQLQLAGNNSQMLQLSGSGGDGTSAVANHPDSRRKRQVSFQEREYGRDNRTLSAILRACAQACDSNGVGTMWSGRENYGYLDLTSLRLIQEQRKPQFRNTEIPGMSKYEVGLGNLVQVEDMRDPRKRTDPDNQKGKRVKYEGIVTDDEPVFSNLDDLPPEMEQEFFEKDGMLKQKYIDTGKYPEYERFQENEKLVEMKRQRLLEQAVEQLQLEAGDAAENGGETHLYFCEETEKWIVGHPPEDKTVLQTATIKPDQLPELPPGKQVDVIESRDDPLQLTSGETSDGKNEEATPIVQSSAVLGSSNEAFPSGRKGGGEETEELFFEDDGMHWKTKDKTPDTTQESRSEPTLNAFEAKALEEARQKANDSDSNSDSGSESDQDSDSDSDFDEEAYERFVKATDKIEVTSDGKFFKDPELEEDFQKFFQFLKEEPDEEMSGMDELEARQFFVMTRSEFEDAMQADDSDPDLLATNSISSEAGSKQEVVAMSKSAKKFDPELETEFGLFFQHAQQSGETLSEAEARELFMSTRAEWEGISEEDFMQSDALEKDVADIETGLNDTPNMSNDKIAATGEEELDALPTMARGRTQPKKEFGEIIDELKEDWGEDGFELDGGEWSDDELDPEKEDDKTTKDGAARDGSMPQKLSMESKTVRTRLMEPSEEIDEDSEQQEEFPMPAQSVESFLAENPPEAFNDDVELAELRQLLPGLPDGRLRKVKQAYQQTLSDPSLLTLVPILRETMPDWYTTRSIRAANLRNARFVFERAEEAGIMSGYLLNGMLQVYTSTGSIDNALALYEEYDKYNAKPTAYSDRLVIQMLLKHQRFRRCLAFKQQVEERGRKLDILAYGPMIDYCSSRGHMGSALMFLKECIRVHGAPPGEAYLKQLRKICRKADMEEEVGLEGLIGKDPHAWLREGVALRRERSKRGRRDVNLVKNAML